MNWQNKEAQKPNFKLNGVKSQLVLAFAISRSLLSKVLSEIKKSTPNQLLKPTLTPLSLRSGGLTEPLGAH